MITAILELFILKQLLVMLGEHWPWWLAIALVGAAIKLVLEVEDEEV